MHARLALMNLDTDKNRKIPPLQYDIVRNLKKNFPNLDFSLNGGIKTLDEIENFLFDKQQINSYWHTKKRNKWPTK